MSDPGLERYKSAVEKLEDDGFMNSSYTGVSMSKHGMTDTDGTPYTVLVSENIWTMNGESKTRKVVVIGADGEASSAFEANGLYLSMVMNNLDAFRRATEEIKVFRLMMGENA